MKIFYIKPNLCKMNEIYTPTVILIHPNSHFYRVCRGKAEAAKDKMRSTKRLFELYLAYGRHCIHCESCEYCKLTDKRDIRIPQMTCPQCGEVLNGRQQFHQNLSYSHLSLIESHHHRISSPKNSQLAIPNENLQLKAEDDDFELYQVCSEFIKENRISNISIY